MNTNNNDYSEVYDGIEFKAISSSIDYVYDEEGDPVYCEYCTSPIIFENGEYICSGCERKISREELFNYIGAEIPGKECLTCDNLYPGCVICPHGYGNDIFEDL